MEIHLAAAAVAGLGAGVVMVAPRLLMRALGIQLRMDVVLMWTTMLRLEGGVGRAAGIGMHLAVSVIIGLLYAVGLRLIFGADDALWLWGLLGGLIHWVIAGAFLVVAPEMNPEMPSRVPAPGAYAYRLGAADVGGFLLGHLAYGLSFGILYALLHPAGGLAAAF